MANQNKSLGKFVLNDIPPAPRGVPQIEVIFDIDANGILNVTAKDKGTGKQQNIRIEAGSGLSKDEIERMKNDAKANEEADKQVREKVEKLNMADGLIFNTEKQLKEHAEKIPADKKSAIEAAVAELKEAHKSEDMAAIDAASEKLNAAWNAASEDIYAQGQADGAQQQGQNANAGGADDVADADFEEVK
ncbi:Chaperone protein dnaK2 [compost metagenome]